ncbi:amino acid ABC transporter substrate-binding protein [Vibrio galatheae]|uniref:Amino acid ABC transporter substrate-binding protein n=1 Tax=Vibrio galatheae TaxID=579748 RepID=A0A0F4NQG2_9VIBR|nr:amino acid ABC transporter substrate-binding protein [Vibrio galatheae]
MKYLALLLLVPFLVEAKSLVIALDDYPPHTSSSNSNHRQLQVPIAAIFETLGYEVKYEYTSWARALKGVKSGKFDITFPWFENASRRDDFILSDKIMTQKVVFFHRRDNNFDWQNSNDLHKYRLGAVVDYTARDVLIDMGLKPFTGNTDTYIFQLLFKERLDAYPATIETGLMRISQILPLEDAAKITYHSKPLFEKDMYLLFSKEKFQDSPLPAQFNQLWAEYTSSIEEESR